MNTATVYHRRDLVRIATTAMTERGLEPEFGPSMLQQLDSIIGPGHESDPRVLDLTAMPWCSIDNDDSRE